MTENSRLLLTDKLLPSSKVQLWLQSSSVISIQTHIETEDIKIFACQRNSCQIMDNSFLNADSLAGPELVPWPTTATGNYAVLWLPTISTTGTGAEFSLLRSVSLILFTILLVRLIKRTILGFSVLFELLLVLYHIVSWYTVIFNSKLLVCVFFLFRQNFSSCRTFIQRCEFCFWSKPEELVFFSRQSFDNTSLQRVSTGEMQFSGQTSS